MPDLSPEKIDLMPEKWMRGVAITTVVLAVVAAIASSRSSFFVARAQLLTALEGSQWGYYQAKSIKEVLFQNQKKVFETDMIGATPQQNDFLNKNVQEYSKNIDRYEHEKADIKKQAEDTNKENVLVGRKGSQFSLSVVFAQIGIMLASVAALLKRKEIWYVGMVIGVLSLFFLANGFLLFL